MQAEKYVFAKDYWGQVIADQDGDHSIVLYGFENVSSAHKNKSTFETAEKGTFWGFVQSGAIEVNGNDVEWKARKGQWFCVASDGNFKLRVTSPETRAFVVLNRAHKGLASMGGPVEAKGRLRYIDGCTDTILYAPPMKGDPCLNLLHFPEGVDQTEHFHPSSRCGIVDSGTGVCVSGQGMTDLVPGLIFYLPRNLRHKFRTSSSAKLNVISFHPDSDWGPTHEVHPMINRTWTGADSQARD